MNYYSKLVSTTALLTLLATSAFAAQTSTSGTAKIVNTDPVLVTATRVERELMQVPMSVTVMTAEEIERNPAATVADLLREIPGIEFQSSTPGVERIGIRGEDAFRTLILIDGQKISEQKSMDGAPILIDPAAIERIEVIKGPASVLYGSDAIGGAINIITKRASDKIISGQISTGIYGNSGGWGQSGYLSGSYNGWSYSLSAANINHDDTNTFNGEIPDSAYSQQDFRGEISYAFNEKFKAGLLASYFNMHSSSTGIEDTGFSGYVKVPKWEMTKVGGYFEGVDITDYLARVRADVWYQKTFKDFENNFDIFADMRPFPPVTMDLKQINTAENDLQTMGFSLQTDWTIGDNHYIIAGYDFAYDNLVADGTGYTGQDFTIHGFLPPSMAAGFVDSVSSYTTKFEGSQMTNALYIAAESTFFDDLTLSYGARYTFVNSDMDTADLFNSDGTHQQTGSLGSSSESKPVFNLGLVYTGFDNLALRALWAQGFRVPTLDNLYVDSLKGDTQLLSNPDLKPEFSNNFEIGLRYNNNKLNVDVAAFASFVEDYITSQTISASSAPIEVQQWKNIGKASTYGIELAADYAFDNGFTPYASATLMTREFEQDGETTSNTGTPALAGQLGVRYFTGLFDNKIDFFADLNMLAQVGSNYYVGTSESHYPGFATFNFDFGFNFGEEKNLGVIFELNNILNKEYYYNTTHDGYAEAGFNGNMRISYKF